MSLIRQVTESEQQWQVSAEFCCFTEQQPLSSEGVRCADLLSLIDLIVGVKITLISSLSRGRGDRTPPWPTHRTMVHKYEHFGFLRYEWKVSYRLFNKSETLGRLIFATVLTAGNHPAIDSWKVLLRDEVYNNIIFGFSRPLYDLQTHT
jgi:hypothetical protein